MKEQVLDHKGEKLELVDDKGNRLGNKRVIRENEDGVAYVRLYHVDYRVAEVEYIQPTNEFLARIDGRQL